MEFTDVPSARSLVWSRTSACHADDPGSNLGARTTHSSARKHRTDLGTKSVSLDGYEKGEALKNDFAVRECKEPAQKVIVSAKRR
jgi:hypothetical protein